MPPRVDLFPGAHDASVGTPFDPLFLSTKKALENFCVPHVSRSIAVEGGRDLETDFQIHGTGQDVG